jgi:cytochrome b subunit of formate dehydrogenase
MKPDIVRFTRRQRFEHAAVMVLFTVLAVTGLPQKFFEYQVSVWILDALGGIDRARSLHRLAGLLFAALALTHVGGIVWDVARGRARLTMVPAKKDFTDAIVTLRYYLGVSNTQARFDRFDYRQKFEYWGLILGAAVVIVTGVILYWPVLAARFLPGEVIPAAKVAHSNEGLLAFLVVILWHVYNAHLNPDVFPFDTSIFTGRISWERMVHEHPLELERLLGASGPDRAAGEGTAATAPGPAGAVHRAGSD